LACWAMALYSALQTYGQGTFGNFNFENVNLVNPPAPALPTLVLFNDAFPGWIGYAGTNQLTQTFNNGVSAGAALVTLITPNSGGASAWSNAVISGTYTAVLSAGEVFPGGGQGILAPAALGQTGLIPVDSLSLRFSLGSLSSVNDFAVTFNGQNVPFRALSTGPNYSVYGGDISAFAGSTGELRFSERPISQPFSTAFLDDIQFSNQPIPEPNVFCLFSLGALLLGSVAAGRAHSVALKNDGTVVAWGDNSGGQTNIGAGPNGIKSIAAGGDHTLAAVFSSYVQYQVDVSKDVLLVYNTNTNSTDSSNVCAYYLAHRPMVSGANVRSNACLTNEIITGAEFTNQFLNPMLDWWAAHPTKRPQYVILFPDFPSTYSYTNQDMSTHYVSSSVSLRDSVAGLQPFVTSINMRTTNDCRAYIDKLEYIGTTYSPGKVVISATGNGTYGNTNYYFDNALPTDVEPTQGTLAKNGAVENGAWPSAVMYAGPTNAHIALATNVTGYLTWGANGGQGAGYATNGTVVFTANSRWYVIETIESFNGKRDANTGQGNFLDWYSQSAFGGTGHSCTPVGAVSHVYEPGDGAWNNPAEYFGLWQAGKSFGACAWNSKRNDRLQVVGDPLVKK